MNKYRGKIRNNRLNINEMSWFQMWATILEYHRNTKQSGPANCSFENSSQVCSQYFKLRSN